MPSDKFITNDQPHIYLIQGFTIGTADADQGDNHAIVMAFLVAGKPGIMCILPESSYMDFLEHLGEAKAKLEAKRQREKSPALRILSDDGENSK